MTALNIERHPIVDIGERKRAVERELCPECGGGLDTGWECNDCGFDAMPLAYTEMDKARERKNRG